MLRRLNAKGTEKSECWMLACPDTFLQQIIFFMWLYTQIWCITIHDIIFCSQPWHLHTRGSQFLLHWRPFVVPSPSLYRVSQDRSSRALSKESNRRKPKTRFVMFELETGVTSDAAHVYSSSTTKVVPGFCLLLWSTYLGTPCREVILFDIHNEKCVRIICIRSNTRKFLRLNLAF